MRFLHWPPVARPKHPTRPSDSAYHDLYNLPDWSFHISWPGRTCRRWCINLNAYENKRGLYRLIRYRRKSITLSLVIASPPKADAAIREASRGCQRQPWRSQRYLAYQLRSCCNLQDHRPAVVTVKLQTSPVYFVVPSASTASTRQ